MGYCVVYSGWRIDCVQGKVQHVAALTNDGAEPAGEYMGPPDDEECREGYEAGRAGKPPRGHHYNIGNQYAAGVKNDTHLHIRLPSESKAAYVKAAQAEGLKLSDWVTRNLDRAARQALRKAKQTAT